MTLKQLKLEDEKVLKVKEWSKKQEAIFLGTLTEQCLKVGLRPYQVEELNEELKKVGFGLGTDDKNYLLNRLG